MRRIVLSHILVTFLSLGLVSSAANADIQTGLVGHWTFDEGEGTVANDSSGNDHHGDIQGGVQWVEGHIRGALDFNGTDGIVEIPYAAEMTPTQGATMSAWVYPTDSTRSCIFGQFEGYGMALFTGLQLKSVIWGGDWVMTETIPEQEWSHLVMTWDVTTGERMIFVNGELVGQQGGSPAVPQVQNPLGIGVWSGWPAAWGDDWFMGIIDDVRLYNRVLSEEDVTELFQWVGGANAGPDQRIEGGNLVTLSGSGPADATSYTWEQIITADEPVVTLSDPNSAITTFTPPSREIGYILTFRLTVDSPTIGITGDECVVLVTAPNEPRIPPQNFRTYPGHLGCRLEWDALVDADDYGVGLKLAPGMYFWFYTDNPSYELMNLQEGQMTEVAVKGRNSYGDGVMSEDIALVAMRNYALPDTLGGTEPPSDYVYAVSRYSITDMNDTEVEDDNNDSYNGIYKSEDYWGYLWPDPIYIDHVAYFTGNMFGNGGWFTRLKVQYTQDGTEWLDVPTRIVPPYNFADERRGRDTYERYDLFIPTVRGTGIRIDGAPGGVAGFTSISELEVFADHVTVRPLVVQGIDGEVPERGTATLDGSFTFSTRGAITSYSWEQVSGTSVTINNADSAVATFDAPGVDADEVLAFRLTASDGTETLSDEDVRITVRNLVTTSVAGPDQSVEEGPTATLDGTGSTTTTGDLSYQWTQTSGDPVTLNNANAAVCTFEAPVIWDYTEELTFRLDVDDGAGGTSSDEVVVEVRNSLAWPAWPYTDAAAVNTGYMTDLLHLGSNPTDRILSPMNINNDPLGKFGGQALVYPIPGEQYDFTDTGVTVTRNPMTWTPIHADNGWFGNEPLDEFEQIYHVYVICPDERPVRFHFRHDDEVRMWNNGILVVNRDGWDNDAEQTEDTILYEGPNSITIKFEEGGGGNYVALGITNDFDELMGDVYYALGPSFVLADAYAVRELPTSYEAGGTVEVDLSVRVNPDNTPSSVTVSETIPGGLTVVDAGGGTVIGGSLNWTFSGGAVGTQTMSYILGVPAGTTGGLNFAGTISFAGSSETLKGDKIVYEVPSAPQNLGVEMLLAANLSWSASPEEGVAGYRVYRSVNGGAWEEIALVSANSYADTAVSPGNTYDYQVAAVSADGVEGPLSSPTGEKMVVMEIREAEDFNYGGGLWPWTAAVTTPAVEATAQDDLDPGNDFWHPNKGGPKDYRPLDDVGIWVMAVYGVPGRGVGWIRPGSWWRYTFDVPEPGPSDPEGGWVKLIFRVSWPSLTTFAVYWDEELVGTVTFTTGAYGAFTDIGPEQFQTTPGIHTLRVEAQGTDPNVDVLDFDKMGIGFNWTKPTREDIFTDDFESYINLYVLDDLVTAGYTVVNGSGEPLGAWRLWNTAGDLLGNEDPGIEGMTDNYVITDSDLAGSVDVDEELITPSIDCTGHLRVRLDFNKNYRSYPDDTEHNQVAEVDVRSSDDGSTWGEWVNLLHYDRTTVAEFDTTPEQVDLSAHADGKFIQVRWRYYEANFDYWFAIDNIRVSGDKEEVPPPKGEILTVGYVAGVADLTWEVFGAGNYTVEYTNDMTSGSWDPIPGETWPITATSWSGDIDAIFGEGVYLRVNSQ